ncbi:hypothetical protein NUSPORA_02443 [Nucleospora cyclopteri]
MLKLFNKYFYIICFDPMFLKIIFLEEAYTAIIKNIYNHSKEISSNVKPNSPSLKHKSDEFNNVECIQNEYIITNRDNVNVHSLLKEPEIDTTNILHNHESTSSSPYLNTNSYNTYFSYLQEFTLEADLIQKNIFCDDKDNLESEIKIYENIYKKHQNDVSTSSKILNLEEDNMLKNKLQVESLNNGMALIDKSLINNNEIEECKIESNTEKLNSKSKTNCNTILQNDQIQKKILEITQKCFHLIMHQKNILNKPKANINKVKIISSQLYSYMIDQQDMQEKCFYKNMKVQKNCTSYSTFQHNLFRKDTPTLSLESLIDDKIFFENSPLSKFLSSPSANDLSFIEDYLKIVSNKEDQTVENCTIIPEDTNNLLANKKDMFNNFTNQDTNKSENITSKESIGNALNPTTTYTHIYKDTSFTKDHTYSILHKPNRIENDIQCIINHELIHFDCQISTDIETTLIKHNVNTEIQPYKINFSSLSSNECDDDEKKSCDNEDEIEEFELYSSHNFPQRLLWNVECNKVHRDSNQVSLFTSYFNFAEEKTALTEKNSLRLPPEFSFSPGWRHFHLKEIITHKNNKKDIMIQSTSKEYGLHKYTSIIYNIVRINTYSKINRSLPFILLFNLVCYNLCSKWDLGKGKNITIKQSFQYHRLINNKNFYRLFKTKTYWQNKAKILFEDGKARALKEFGITESSFKDWHLYNFLILLPLKNSKTISFVCYVFHAQNSWELDTNLVYVSKENMDLVINKRKKIIRVCDEYKKYIDNARITSNARQKTFNVYN